MTEIKVMDICEKAKYASNQFLAVSAKEKNVLLETIRDLIYANIEELKEVNKLDLSQGEKTYKKNLSCTLNVYLMWPQKNFGPA